MTDCCEIKFNNIEKFFLKSIILTDEFLTFEIRSNDYDLRKEMGIICYYNLNDEYDDEILNEILKEIKDRYKT